MTDDHIDESHHQRKQNNHPSSNIVLDFTASILDYMQLVFFLWNKRRKRDLLNIIRLNFQFANRNVENKNKKTKQTGWNNSLGRVFPISINCWEFRTVESHRKNQSIFAWTMARLSLVNAIRIERNDMQTSRAENFGESNRMHKPYIYYHLSKVCLRYGTP